MRHEGSSKVGRGRPPRRWDPANYKTLRTRLTLDLAAATADEAARRGMTMQDFVGELISEATGVPYDPQEGCR